MGQSHFKSNYIGYAGTEYIASVAAIKNVALIEGTTMNVVTASVNTLKASGAGDLGYVQIGATQKIFAGPSNTEASIVAEATAIAGAVIIGGMYLSRVGEAWIFTSNTAASVVGLD